MIIAQDLSLQYKDGTFGLKNVNITLPKGKLIFITGPSGSGKTSFVKLILGMEKLTSGNLSVLNYDMKNITERELVLLRQDIGPIFQDFKLLDGRSVCDNVLVGMRFLKIEKEDMYEKALKALEKVGLSHKVHSMVENLSYGERQRIAIARAVARDPKIIIADEPTGNLDKNNSLIVLDLLRSFQNEDTTIIITTHATHLIKDVKDSLHIDVEEGNLQYKEAKYE